MSGRLIGDSLHLTQTFVVPWGWFLYNITSDPSLKRHHQAAEVPQSYFFFTICFDYKRSTTTSLYTQQHPHGKSLKTGRLPQAYRACLRSSDPFLNRFFFFSMASLVTPSSLQALRMMKSSQCFCVSPALGCVLPFAFWRLCRLFNHLPRI